MDRIGNRNDVLDLLKFIASFFIVCIHFKFHGALGEWVTVLARFAVPVFFLVSGYFSYRDDRAALKRKLLRIVKLYLIAIALYFAYSLATKLLAGQYAEAKWFVSTYFRPRYMLPLLLFNESNTAIHLWFLGALIYVYIIEWVLTGKQTSDRGRWIAIGLCLGVHLVLGIGISLLGVTPPALLLKNCVLRNFLFLGFPFFSLGRMFHKHEETVTRTSGILLAGVILLGIFETVVMYKLDWTKELYLGSILLSAALFVLVIKGKSIELPLWLTNLFRTSTWVYVIHVLVGDVLVHVFQSEIVSSPFVVFAVSVLIAWVRDWMFQKKTN